jgi:UPF0716 protein FxsA
MFFLIVFVALIGIPLLEIYVVIEVSRAIGLVATLALLILDAMIGTMLVRSQSRAVWRRARQTLRQGRAPAREVLDGALVIAGGALLIAPGFITDLLGALLLAPPTRAVIRRLVIARFTRTIPTRVRGSNRSGGVRSDARGRSEYDVESRAVEIDPHELES